MIHECLLFYLIEVEAGDEAVEFVLVGVVVIFPVAEVGDVVCADFTRQVFAGVGVEGLPGTDFVEWNQGDGEELTAVLFDFVLAGVVDFGFDPLAVHAVVG